MVDFDFTINATPFVADQWSRIVCLTNSKTPGTWKDVINAYTISENKLKEYPYNYFRIHMKKQILWNYAELTQSLMYCIKNAGYDHSISITYPMRCDKVKAFSSGPISQMAHSIYVQIFCVLTCLCIIFAPIFYATRKKIDMIVCEFPITMPARDFYMRF